MAFRKLFAGVVFCVMLASSTSTLAAYDVLELAAEPSELATQSMIYTVAKFGDRYFATGIRGHILYSDDGGKNWTQAKVPVRSSILDISFPSAKLGWAVGHDGVILHSSDGGESWVKQYDGNQFGVEGLAFYKEKLAADPDNETLALLVEEMMFAVDQGADKPFFKVRFHTDEFGHAFGAYGIVLATFDGGKSWVPRMETVDNFGFNHLFDYSVLADRKFFICGEMGVVLETDISSEDIDKRATVALNTPWDGSFFTCATAADGSVVMGGLRGNVFRSEDIKSWSKAEKPATSSIIDSIVLADGRLLLASQGGDVLVSDDNGKSFSGLPIKGVEGINSIAEGEPGKLLIANQNGIHTVDLEHK